VGAEQGNGKREMGALDCGTGMQPAMLSIKMIKMPTMVMPMLRPDLFTEPIIFLPKCF
jgi:hypothetical protein